MCTVQRLEQFRGVLGPITQSAPREVHAVAAQTVVAAVLNDNRKQPPKLTDGMIACQ
jgi:hypothetical protein